MASHVICNNNVWVYVAQIKNPQMHLWCCIWLLHLPFKVQWHQMVTFRSVQCHPGLTYIFNF